MRAGAGALGSLRNVIAAHVEAAMSSCPERGWDKLLRFLCATGNDCWQLVADAVPSVEERHPRAMTGMAKGVIFCFVLSCFDVGGFKKFPQERR